MEIKELAAAWRRRWLTFLLAALATVLAVVGYTLLQEPAYEATTRVVATPTTTAEQVSPREAIAFAQAQARSFPGVVTSNDVLMPAIQELNLTTRPDSLARHIDATVPIDALWMDISVTDPSPETAAAISRSVATHFIERINMLNGSVTNPQNLRVVVITQAQAPTSPSSPNWRLSLAAAGLLALILGLLAVTVKDLSDPRVRDAESTEKITRRPSLMITDENSSMDLAAAALAAVLKAELPTGGRVAVMSVGDIGTRSLTRALEQASTRQQNSGDRRPDSYNKYVLTLEEAGSVGATAAAFKAASDADQAILILAPQTKKNDLLQARTLLSRLNCPIAATAILDLAQRPSKKTP